MCCFTGRVDSVSDTSIFARLDGGRQVLVYAMSARLPQETAMVLPLPVVVGCGEDAVRFVSLEAYPGFFADLQRLFPRPLSLSESAAPNRLTVHSVGRFEASYVPDVRGFARLDPRFRLPEGAWADLPGYRDYGFAVFKLKAGSGPVHPMALTFPTRHPEALFFPTVHIHDGKVRPSAAFDHTLYAQGAAGPSWRPSGGAAGSAVRVDAAQGLLAGGLPVFRRRLEGVFENRDVTLPGWEPAPDWSSTDDL